MTNLDLSIAFSSALSVATMSSSDEAGVNKDVASSVSDADEIKTAAVPAGNESATLLTTNSNKKTKANKKARNDADSNIIDVVTPAAAASSTTASASSTATAATSSTSAATSLLQSAFASVSSAASSLASAVPKEYKFWSTQPVPRLTDKPTEHGPLERKVVSDILASPYPLPKSFEWATLEMNNPTAVDEIYKLLNENYVEDDDNMFRFDYSRSFLQWALLPPHYRSEYHIGVRLTTNGKLVGFISGIPQNMRIYQHVMPMVEINFLCVHKRLRSKRLAPVLIKEVTRRVNRNDVWQAVYTAGVVLPKPVSSTRYFHRSLNPKKLIDIGFSRLQPRMTLARTIRLYKLPSQPVQPSTRAMTEADVEQVHALLMKQLSKYSLTPQFTAEEVAHWLLPREKVVYSYVILADQQHPKKITDLFSFYSLPSTIIGNNNYNTLNAAYSFYNVSTITSWPDLMTDALIMALNNGFDVFNALNLMENESFLTKLKFGPGDGLLQYYLYNWQCPEMPAGQVGLVLL